MASKNERNTAAVRRLQQLQASLSGQRTVSTSVSDASNDRGDRVCIGDVCISLQDANTVEKVPVEGMLDISRMDVLEHLQWMMRKDLLGQDIFLIGPPGPLKRHLALTYLHLTNREHEYVALHRDISAESDLKQRREIVRDEMLGSGLTAKWVDGVAVRAAIEGRVLVIDGIEKAERNVLPVLNNLLENREMNLEDGRHIVHHARYDALLQNHTREELDSWRLVRASDRFRVIALGVPVPPYPGNSLDPPFRSRFQVRYVESPYDGSEGRHLRSIPIESTTHANAAELNILLAKLRDVVQAVQYAHEIKDQLSISSSEAATSSLLPSFPQTTIGGLSDLFTLFPKESEQIFIAMQRYWPGTWVGANLTSEQWAALASLATKLQLNIGDHSTSRKSGTPYELTAVRGSTALFNDGSTTVTLPTPVGPKKLMPIESTDTGASGHRFVNTPRYRDLVTRIAQAHAMGDDICLVGGKGTGKTSSIMRFVGLFGYNVETVHMYRDMTARDLLQRRGTRQDGSTFWEDSGLVRAALEGKLAVLDGLHWVRAGTIASLQRLVQDREAVLPDGSILLNADNFDALLKRSRMSPEQLLERGVRRVHPSFRIIATASMLPHHKANKQDLMWLTEEVGTMFQFIEVSTMDVTEEASLVRALTACPEDKLAHLLAFARRFRKLAEGEGSGHETVLAKSTALSTRQIIRICKRLAAYPDEDLYSAIHRTCLSPFLPQLARQALAEILADSNIRARQHHPKYDIEISDTSLRIGDVTLPKYVIRELDVEAKALIPHTSENGPGFFDNEVHTRVMREIAVDYGLGEHLLLIGNQGVGKNKLTDRFLELMGFPREYVQLHRDTTVQSLTIQPTVENGIIIYKDSPLVRAVKNGRILVVDEADKAPVHITSILKSLAESGEMVLADGRRIRPPPHAGETIDHKRDVITHPDFRMIVLANRPGYPFLGNDFFGSIGEVFSCHAVENPDTASELSLLRQAAPAVDPMTLEKLVHAFGDLRQAFDNGLVSYPYSLRELMNIVKHMQAYPDDPLDQILRNVFDFDVHRKDFFEVLVKALSKHGLNVAAVGFNAVKRGNTVDGEKQKLEVKWEQGKNRMPPEASQPKHGKVDNQPHVGGNQWAGGSGGSDTAGIGGRAGPYRLHKKGNPIVRLPDHIKNDVPEHVKEAARQMGREALKKRLAEIKMSAYEASVYKDIYDAVSQEIRQLKVVLEGVQAKEKERTWLQNQTDGDLDDAKIIDGLTGETSIYKRRGEETPEHGAAQNKPKRLKFVFDVSASMYSYNEHDGRLNRSLETALMIMESLQSLGDKYVYDIVGHSGDSDCIELVAAGKPPQNEMERMKVLQTMSAHSQYCFSGDKTLAATEKAVKDIVKDDADDYFVLVLSDANLRRYGIRPPDLGKRMEADAKVNCAVLFIGSIGEEARMLTRELPAGKAFVALDTSDIPKIMKSLLMAV
ncbi:AAA domain-containing protein [Gaertneriomyces semiglobifer]|nr:AAA domain-containing protein [Gaertneriomyces semiglobifer]